MDLSRRRPHWGRPPGSSSKTRRIIIAADTQSDARAQKAALRQAARADRNALHAGLGAAAATGVAARFCSTPALRALVGPTTVVSGYMPIGSELDCRLLLQQLAAANVPLCLPVVAERGAPLVFRRWAPGDRLASGVWGIAEPPADAPEVTPDVLLVPMLAYDRSGNRLGYGGGYYDRTLRALRAAGEVVAIGLAFAGQLRDKLPVTDSDQPLDWIVTEIGVVFCAGGDAGD